MEVSAHRRFMLDGQDVSNSLNGSTEVFDSYDTQSGQSQEQVTVGRSTFYDVQFTDPNGHSEISRSRFTQGAMDTESYWIQRQNGEMQNVGRVMEFSAPDTGERYTVTNQCGQEEERRGFTLTAALMFRNSTKPLENGVKHILEWCLTKDHWTHTAALRRNQTPETPVIATPVPTPTEAPTPAPDFPGQYPAQYVPYK
jgi:hypothetical protein